MEPKSYTAICYIFFILHCLLVKKNRNWRMAQDCRLSPTREIKVSFDIYSQEWYISFAGAQTNYHYSFFLTITYQSTFTSVITHLNALFNTKNFILLRNAEKYAVAHCAPWLTVPHSPTRSFKPNFPSDFKHRCLHRNNYQDFYLSIRGTETNPREFV